MKNFRLLKPEEIECRVQKCSAKGCSILLYKTARTDADLLDEKYGMENWQNDFKVIDGTLYGGIGIYNPQSDEWFWKWDAGTESNTEAEKGRASDAFKRAGFKFGIGRELYSAPFIWIPAGRCNVKESNGKYVCYDKFAVTSITYDRSERISGLIIANQKGDIIYEMETTQETIEEIICESCGKPISPAKRSDGTPWSAAEIAEYTKAATGKTLCISCGKAEFKRLKREAEQYATREDGVE